MKKWLTIAGWIAVGLTVLFFMQNGIQKIVGTAAMVEMLQSLGYPRWARIAIGAAEVSGALILAVPRTTRYGAIGLSALMAGATAVELANGHGFEAVLAGQWLVVLVCIAVIRSRYQRKQTKEATVHE
ncbi:DoxX family protein [Paenibacillus sp. 1P07SE]|uniref:DoxX family protein n=1 Tax=Paenibacillus sp. 1P07SE TaxID=3132209 RepID=UPI0039A61ADF